MDVGIAIVIIGGFFALILNGGLIHSYSKNGYENDEDENDEDKND